MTITAGEHSADVIVAGVGNIFLGDDGFGSEVLRHLASSPLPPGVEARDYGIGGVHLAYDLLDGCRMLVLVDALSRGGSPGSVYVVEASLDDLGSDALDAHGMDPQEVLGTLGLLGGTLPRTVVVGCEPASTDEGIGLSPAVAAAVDVAAQAVRDLLAEVCDGQAARKER